MNHLLRYPVVFSLVAILSSSLGMEVAAQVDDSQVSGTFTLRHAPEAGLPSVTNFAPDEYDAGSANWEIVEDSRGIIYVGNPSGILEFDGSTWRLIPLPNQQTVRAMAADDHGQIWVGGAMEFGYLAPDSLGQTSYVSLTKEVPEAYKDFSTVWSVDVTDAGVSFQTNEEIFLWDGADLRVWPAGERSFHQIFSVHETLYVRRHPELLRIGFGEHIDNHEDIFHEIVAARELGIIYAMLPYSEDQVLLGTRDEGLYLFDGERVEPFPTQADAILKTGVVYNGVALPGGRFAFGTLSNGVVVIDRAGNLIFHLNKATGLPSNVVFASYVDRSGNLWLGLQNGVSKINVTSPFSFYGELEGIAAAPLSIARHNGRLFADIGSAGMVVLDTKEGRFVPVENAQEQAFSMLSVGGDLLATLSGVDRIVETSVGGFRTESIWESIAAYELYGLRGDTSLVLVGLKNGLALLRKHSTGWIKEGLVPGVNGEIWKITEDVRGTIWAEINRTQILRVQFAKPLGKEELDLSTAETSIFGEEDGLGSGGNYLFRVQDNVFVAGADGEVFRFDEQSEQFMPVHTFGNRGPLVEDSRGRLWSFNGPSVGLPNVQGEYDFELIPALSSKRFGKFYPESDGVVWMLHSEGLVRYEQLPDGYETPSFPPLVRSVTVGEDSLVYGGLGLAPGLEIAHEVGTVRFAFAAPGAPSTQRMRTRLDGFDREWSSWSTETNRTYTNLPAGTYRFRVEAERRGETGIVFTVLPPWYQTWWAYGIYLVLFAMALFAADRTQRRRIIRRERIRAEISQERLRAESAERELKQAREIESAYHKLKATQAKLVQSEKMASLGQLTAGIAHEIKNPLNFINNFAEVNQELADEALEAFENGESPVEILSDIRQNARVIADHGRRADTIVRSMMQHASGGQGKAEPTHINKLIAEHIDLAYHGKRAQISDFQVEMRRDFDEDIGRVVVKPEDIGRVILNLLGNAFDAVLERAQRIDSAFTPTVTVSTKKQDDDIEIRVSDNGSGIPADIIDRIFDPFFTTKSANSGTGLGLSLSHDIVEQGHGGTLVVESDHGTGATFIVTLPTDGSRVT